MTIGERIQMLRKNNGLSQEDLAKKLLVSRQTVSQWETDQTIPSVDNIYRLKEILNVSFDELMSDEKAEKEETEKEKPLEEYEYISDEDEIKAVMNFASNFNIKKIIFLFVFLIVIFIYGIYIETNEMSLGLLIGVIFMFAVQVFLVLKNRKKSVKRHMRGIDTKRKQLRLFSDRLEYICFRNGEMSDKFIIRRDEIEAFYENDKYCAFIRENMIFSINKSVMKKDSHLYKFIYKSKDAEENIMQPKKTVLSVILIAASVISPWLAMGFQQYFYDYFDQINCNNMVAFFVFTPIPLLSIIYGIYQNKKGYRNKRNIITGAIVLAFLCIFGSFVFMFSGYSYSDYREITKWEEIIGVDLPENADNLIQYEDKISHGEKVHYHEKSNAQFTDEDAVDFLKQISKDERWAKEFSDNVPVCLPDNIFWPNFDYHFLYNQTTGEVNTVPKESGKYRFVYFKYMEEDCVLEIEDYTIDLNIG